MAKYDQGGGCACGLRCICDCGVGLLEKYRYLSGRDDLTGNWITTYELKEEDKMVMSHEDFGFTFSDGSDLPEVHQALANANSSIEHATNLVKSRNDALETVLSMMNNFLDNLAKEPDKKYLLWPDRAAKVKAFKDKLNHYAD